MNRKAIHQDEFYVGYLPAPRGHLRFVRVLVPIMLWIMVFAAIGLAWSQRDPGPAAWDDGMEREWVGTLVVHPYPMLMIEEGDDRGMMLLVEQGKRGAGPRAAAVGASKARVRGWRLERDGRRMIELSPESNAVERIGEPARLPNLSLEGSEPILLRGEIVDAKCYLGAMKPGEGPTHKACAILCLTGGIPPMLVSRDGGRVRYFLLTDSSGGPMPSAMIRRAGEPIELRGRAGRIDDLEVFALLESRPEHHSQSTPTAR